MQRVPTNEHCARLELLSSVRGAHQGQLPPAGALRQRGEPQPSCPHPGLTQVRGAVEKNPYASTPLAWFQESPTCWISLSPQSLSKPVAQPGSFLGSHS